MLLQPGVGSARPGDIDPTFGNDGVVTVRYHGSLRNTAGAVLIDRNDYIVVAATGRGGNQIYRYTSEGEPDPDFGKNGAVTVPIGILSIALQTTDHPNTDRILAAGYVESPSTGVNFALARLLPDGTADPTFGNDGIVSLDFFGGSDLAFSVSVQDDGKILVGGYASAGESRSFAVARFRKSGNLDASFGNGSGRVTIKVRNGADDEGRVVVQLTDGRIVVGGSSYFIDEEGFEADFALVALEPDGSIDDDFGADGIARLFGGDVDLTAMARTPEGGVVVVGSVHASSYDFAIARVDGHGSLDPAFGENGRVAIDVGGDGRDDFAFGVDVLADGAVLVSGSVRDTDIGPGIPHHDFGVVKLLGSGDLDPDFGESGIVRYDYKNRPQRGGQHAIQSTGSIVLAGSVDNTSTGTGWDVLLTRLAAGGDEDASFGDDGTVVRDLQGDVENSSADVLVRDDGRILVCGLAGDDFELRDFAFSQHTPDGEPDPAFGKDGTTLVDIASSQDGAVAMVEDDQERIVAVGVASSARGVGADLAMVRLLPDGNLDPAFGDGGRIRSDVSGGSDVGQAVALANDGKIIVAVRSITGPDARQVVKVLRYIDDGTPDAGFGLTGIGVSDVPGMHEVSGILPRDDGSIVVVGSAFVASEYRICVARLTSSGELDTSFGDGGISKIDVDDTSGARTFAAGPGQTLLIGGRSWGEGSYDAMVLRLLENGDLDPSFGDFGVARTDIGSTYMDEEILDLTVQQDGKIVAAGCSGFFCEKLALFRYDADGTLDSTTFGSNGTAIHDFGPSRYRPSNPMALQQDGALVVAADQASGSLLLRFQGDQPTVTCGDADLSTTVAAGDALLALRTAVGTAFCLPCLCDVDGSGAVSATDALTILNNAVGLDAVLQCAAGC